jgi:hypothetical protein
MAIAGSGVIFARYRTRLTAPLDTFFIIGKRWASRKPPEGYSGGFPIWVICKKSSPHFSQTRTHKRERPEKTLMSQRSSGHFSSIKARAPEYRIVPRNNPPLTAITSIKKVIIIVTLPTRECI